MVVDDEGFFDLTVISASLSVNTSKQMGGVVNYHGLDPPA